MPAPAGLPIGGAKINKFIINAIACLLVLTACTSKSNPAVRVPSITASTTSATTSQTTQTVETSTEKNNCNINWTTGAGFDPQYTAETVYQVDTGRHACYDRVVFRVAGAAGYNVAYVPVVTVDGSGDSMPVTGSPLQVIIHAPAQTGAPQLATLGQYILQADWTALKTVRYAGSFEGQTTFAVGVKSKLPFRVFIIEEAGERTIILDIAHEE